MLRTAFFSLILVVSFVSSTSMLRKSVVRRQSGDGQYCHGIEGFQCQCSFYRITCTTDRELPSPLVVSPHEQHKYQTVELVITGARVVNVNEQTFAPVKELFRPDGENFEFRVKFEGFTGLRLGASVLNQVFPANLPGSARKQLALDVYNTEVKPDNDPHLFQNLQADTLELYTIHPLKGSFQQLFDGANIKYIRLSGGDLRSEPSQSFTGNIGRLELAKQATQLSVENFPVFPAHELIINAFYVDDFNPQHAPNYDNLAELHVQSLNAIPANAFRNYPNIRSLQITTEKDIDPQALNGLNKLEKLVIKDTKPSLELLKNLPNLKELVANIEKLDEKTQCQLLDKLASGQLAVQAIPNGRECTCVSAYLDAAAGRHPCDAQHCEHASCAAIKNNYNAADRTFNAPPRILRADGSDALRQREPKVYTGPYQISSQDQEKLQRGAVQVVPQQPVDESQRPGEGDQGRYPNQPYPQDTAQGDYWGYGNARYDQIPSRHDDNQYNGSPSRTDDNQYNDSPSRTDDNQYNESPSRTDDNQYNENPSRNDDTAYHENPNRVDDTPYNENPSRNDDNQNDQSPSRNDDIPYNENPSRTDDTPYNENPSRNDDNQNDQSPSRNDDNQENENPSRTDDNQENESPSRNDEPSVSEKNQGEENNPSESTNNNVAIDDNNVQPTTTAPAEEVDSNIEEDIITTTTPYSLFDDQQEEGGPTPGGTQEGQPNEGTDNQPGETDGDENRQGENPDATNTDGTTVEGGRRDNDTNTDTPTPGKRKMSWLPIIIILAILGFIALIGLIVYLVRRKNTNKGGYSQTSTAEPGTARPTQA